VNFTLLYFTVSPNAKAEHQVGWNKTQNVSVFHSQLIPYGTVLTEVLMAARLLKKLPELYGPKCSSPFP